MSSYTDPYLSGLVNSERIDRATADIAAMGAFDRDWTDRLIEIRVYILTCLESTQSAEDIFSAKLKHYRQEFSTALIAAKQAAAAQSGQAAIFASVGLERG